jgi:hypothetical protein
MKVKVDMTKENIKILQNLKNSNTSDISFKVWVEDNRIDIYFEKLVVKEADYVGINNSFIDEIKESLNQSEFPFTTENNDDLFVIEEITEKKVLVALTVENTIALEDLKIKFPNKTQADILNELFKIGYENFKKGLDSIVEKKEK